MAFSQEQVAAHYHATVLPRYTLVVLTAAIAHQKAWPF